MTVSPSRRLSPAALTFLTLTLAASGMAALLALLPAAGHDQMWLLYAARLTLNGAPLYGPTVFETNPPVILWLSMVPAALAPLLHIADTALGKFFTIALIAAIGAVCLNLLRKLRPTLSPEILWALAFSYVTIFTVMPARDLGQRDDFLVLFILPYVFAATVRAEGIAIEPLPATLIGVLALAGVALKPHQILIPIALEITLLSYRRFRALFRPEVLAMVASGLLFLAAIHRFAPLYFTLILPLVSDTYWAYHQLTLLQLAGASIQLDLLLLADTALIYYLTWSKTPTLPRILFIAGAAATAAFYVQGTGWYYQQLPALSLLALALVFLAIQLAEVRNLGLPSWSPRAAAALGVLALALTTHFMDYPFTSDRSFPLDAPDPAFFANLAPGTPVMTISPTVDYTIQPIYKFHLTLGQRYPAFLMLPALLRSEDPQGGPLTKHLTPARIAELDHIQRHDMIEDLARWHPQLILVQRCQKAHIHCQVLEDRDDDLLAWFLRDPAFVAAWSHYTYTGTRGEFDAYTLKP